MKPEEAARIRALPLFHQIAPAHFEALTRGAYLQSFPPRVDLITEGEHSDFLHVVVEGTVELFAHWNGHETTMDTVRPLATFILAATIRDEPYLMSARTLERSQIIMLPSADVRAIFAADHAFARAIVGELAQRYRGVIRHAKDLKLRNATERLANYLLRQAQGEAVFDLPIEKRRLAAYLNMTPENLSRAFRALAGHGVGIDGPRVTLHDHEALRAFAMPTPLLDASAG